MTTVFSIMGALAYLAVGVVVARQAARIEFTTKCRWWHVVLWPLIPVYYGIVLLGFWMAGDR